MKKPPVVMGGGALGSRGTARAGIAEKTYAIAMNMRAIAGFANYLLR